MLKQLNQPELFKLFEEIAKAYRLLVPQALDNGTRGLLPWDGEHICLIGELLQRKPTCHFFPQTDLLVRLNSAGQADSLPEIAKPLALCGLNREDLHAVSFIDRFFLAEPKDDVYRRKRENALLIGITGYAGPDQDFLPLAGDLCDLELIHDQGDWLATAYSEAGNKWLSDDYSEASNKRLEQLRQKSSSLIAQRRELVSHASQLLRTGQVSDSFWEEISSRCIRCGGCNFACPTCTCFCVQDRSTTMGIERSRIWDSCQLDAFMREASGHNPLGTDMLRTRRRIHHKLVDDPQSWGEFGCILCGRCDRACPTGIGMFAICEEIVRRFDGGHG